jgi:hypothetical protein
MRNYRLSAQAFRGEYSAHASAKASAECMRTTHTTRFHQESTMLIATDRTRMLLERGQSTRLTHAAAAHLSSAAGTLWVTIDHDARDIILEPGQGFTVRSSEAVTISALSGPAVLDLRPIEACG